MYAPSRLGGLVVAGAVVTAALAGLSLLSIATAGGRPAWLASGDSTIEAGQEAIVGGRIAGVLARPRFRKLEKIHDLGVILGSSAVSMAVDPEQMEKEAGKDEARKNLPTRWLSLYANGANVEDIRGLVDLLFQSDLRPRILVLGLHPGLLARSDDYLSDRTQIDAGALEQKLAVKQLLAAKDEFVTLSVVPLNWAFPNRTRISNRVRVLAAGAKRRMFAALGQGAGALYPADPDPWNVRPLLEDSAGPPAEAEGRTATVRDRAEGPMREGIAGPVKDKGWTNPGAYDVDGANAHALVAIIAEARARGTEVAILLLPERAVVRQIVPPEAMRCLWGALDRGFGEKAPVVVDLRASLLDSQFHDSIHATKESRPATTRRLADALRREIERQQEIEKQQEIERQRAIKEQREIAKQRAIEKQREVEKKEPTKS